MGSSFPYSNEDKLFPFAIICAVQRLCSSTTFTPVENFLKRLCLFYTFPGCLL